MKIFFGGSIPGFIEDKNSYLRIRNLIVKLGNSLTRDWLMIEIRGKKTRPSDMVNFTQKAINKSDATIIEGSHDISAVGSQIKLSVEKGLPTLVLLQTHTGKKNLLSDYFIEEKYHKFVKVEKYDLNSLEEILSNFLSWARTNRKIVRFNLEIEKDKDDYLKVLADRNKTSKSEEIRKLIAKDMTENYHFK